MYVKCTHTKSNRVQECVLVLVADRLACIPIAPAENAVGKIAGGIAMTAVGLVKLRLGTTMIDVADLSTADDVAAAGGFFLDAQWTYRTGVPVIGTMLMHGTDVITTRERVPAEMLALLTPNRAPPSAKIVKVFCAVGAAILAAATITYLATGSFELLFGIGFWGVLIIGTSLFAWIKVSRSVRRQG